MENVSARTTLAIGFGMWMTVRKSFFQTFVFSTSCVNGTSLPTTHEIVVVTTMTTAVITSVIVVVEFEYDSVGCFEKKYFSRQTQA